MIFMTNTKALQLASRFALPPNSLGYCGKGTAPEKFKNCILGKGCDGVSEEIDKFVVLGPYLETLSEITGGNKYRYSSVEAYWLGNDELKKAKQEDYGLLLKNFEKQGVPPWLIGQLKEKQPKEFIPFHLFQVLHVGVGRASGSVPYNMETINNCMIRWGKVEKIAKRNLKVSLNSLKRSGRHFSLTSKKGRYPYRGYFMADLKMGDILAVHWKQVVKKLAANEVKNLEFWTKRVLSTLQG
jgi:hypothetical protein